MFTNLDAQLSISYKWALRPCNILLLATFYFNLFSKFKLGYCRECSQDNFRERSSKYLCKCTIYCSWWCGRWWFNRQKGRSITVVSLKCSQECSCSFRKLFTYEYNVPFDKMLITVTSEYSSLSGHLYCLFLKFM